MEYKKQENRDEKKMRIKNLEHKIKKTVFLIVSICSVCILFVGCASNTESQEDGESVETDEIKFASKDYDVQYSNVNSTCRALIDLTNDYIEEIDDSTLDKYDEEENSEMYKGLNKELKSQVKTILDNSIEKPDCSIDEICSYIIDFESYYDINSLISLLESGKYDEGIDYIAQSIGTDYKGCLECWILNIYPDIYTKGIPDYINFLKSKTKTVATTKLENAKNQFKEDSKIPEDMFALLNIADAEISQLPDEVQKPTYEHVCEVDGCAKEGTRCVAGFSGQLGYYCEEHYKKIKDTTGNM